MSRAASSHFHDAPGRARAFSLIELVIVVLIIGTLATIAVPRFISASQRSTSAALLADTTAMQRAIDFYTAEHAERCPAIQAGGTVSTDAAEFEQRLTGKTQISGQIDSAGIYGPYLRELPVNPVNGLKTVRINGVAAGAGTHGWRYDSATMTIRSDHSSVKLLDGDDLIGGGKVDEEDVKIDGAD